MLVLPVHLIQPVWDFGVDRLVERSKRTPYFDLDGYMDRWWVLKKDHPIPFTDAKTVPLASRIHCIKRSDSDSRNLHDHPWDFVTVVLRGGYWQILPKSQHQHPALDATHFTRTWHGPGSVLYVQGHERHRLELPEGQHALTLFTIRIATKLTTCHQRYRPASPMVLAVTSRSE